jgi:DNA-binding CsgD family transcriptional regulator
MSSLDDRTFDKITDLLFETVHDDGKWSGAMGAIRESVDASNGAFGYVDVMTGAQMMLHAECPEQFAGTFLDTQVGNPLAPAVLFADVGAVHIDQMVMPREEFERGTFFNEWLRPQDATSVLTVPLWRHGAVGGHLTVLRGGKRRSFDSPDVSVLTQLMPVLRRVARLRAEFGGQRLLERLVTLDISNGAFFVVDAKGRILAQNAAAEQELRNAESGLVATNGILRVEGRMRERFRSAVDTAASHERRRPISGDMLLESPLTGRRQSALSVLPLPDAPSLGLPVGRAAGILVRRLGARKSSGFEDRVRGLFVLTARECQLAVALASGLSVQDFATAQGITMPTARSHLSQLLHKTETRRQGELIALLHRVTN